MGSGSQKVFASVKSFGQRGKLLSRAGLRALAESRDLDELATRIRATAYGGALPAEAGGLTAGGIEWALRGRLAEVHYSIAKTAGSEALDAYYLRFAAWNLKAILKGKALGRSQEEIEPGINMRAEELIRQRDVILRALVAKDAEEAASSLGGTVFGDDAARAVALYNETGNLQVVDAHLDRAMMGQLGRALRRSKDRDLIRLVSMDVDFYNLLCALRGKFWGLDEQQVLGLMAAHTPTAPRELLARMAGAATLADAVAELGQTRYAGLAPRQGDGIGAISEFERAFEGAMYRAAARSFTKMFSPVTSVGITKLTGYEVRNIAAIAFAVEQGMPAEDAMSGIIAGEE